MKKMNEYSINSINKTSNIILNFTFLVYSLVCILPIFLLVSISLSDKTTLLTNGYSILPEKLSFVAYEFLFKDSKILINAYMVTIFITIVGTLLTVLLTVLYAYPISRKDFPFRKFFTHFILITMLFSGGLVPFYLVYTRIFQFKDTPLALILPLMTNAFWILVTRTFFSENIPDAVIESARIDGAGELRIFYRIVLPLSLPLLATIALFTTFSYWNDWFNGLLFINKEKLEPLQLVMMKALLNVEFIKQQSGASSDLAKSAQANIPSESLRMAMAVLGVGPIIIVYPFFQKYFISGLTIGSVKG